MHNLRARDLKVFRMKRDCFTLVAKGKKNSFFSIKHKCFKVRLECYLISCRLYV